MSVAECPGRLADAAGEGWWRLPEPDDGLNGARGMVRTIPVDAIRPNPYQPRRDPASANIDELVESVREHGILQPVLLRPVDSGFELVAGERRWRAAQAAGLSALPAVVREMSDRDAAVLALVENLQRADLPFFDEAEGYRLLLEEFRLSQEELAAQVGRSQPAIANKIRLLRLEPGVRERISREMLSERHARVLLSLETEAARLEAVEAFVSQGLTVRQAEDWVERRTAAQEGKRRNRARGVVRDLRIYLNAVQEVARGLRQAGFPAHVTQEEDPDGWVLHLRIGRRT